jgi:hypothetical protein
LVIVGETKKVFHIDRAVVTKGSKLATTKDPVICLLDQDSDAFEAYSKWLYTHKPIPRWGPTSTKVKMHTLALAVDDKLYQDAVMDNLVELCNSDVAHWNGWSLDLADFYKYSVAASAPRRLILDCWINSGTKFGDVEYTSNFLSAGTYTELMQDLARMLYERSNDKPEAGERWMAQAESYRVLVRSKKGSDSEDRD